MSIYKIPPNFEIGTRWKTRNGRVAVITATDLDGLRPVSAIVAGPNERPHNRYYNADGFEKEPIGNGKQESSPYDLTTCLGDYALTSFTDWAKSIPAWATDA